MPISRIPASTLEAYRQTQYRVQAPQPLVLTVGQASLDLFKLHQQYRVLSSAFITACNPHSRLLSDAENADRQQRLREALNRSGWPFLLGGGKHISGSWPEEPSFLVLGISRNAAWGLAESVEQNAFLFCAADCIPELVLLR